MFNIYDWKHKSKNSHSPDLNAKLVGSELKKHSDKNIVIIDKKAIDEDFKISEKLFKKTK